MVKIVLLTALFFLSGCAWLSPFSGNTKSSQTNYTKASSDESYKIPIVIDGETVILDYRKKTAEVNRVREDKPLNAWQKFCRWLGNLGILTILIVAGGLAAGTGGPLLFLWGRYQAFRKALIQTVSAIEKTKTVNKDVELKNALSSTHDTDSKRLIDDIRRGTGAG